MESVVTDLQQSSMLSPEDLMYSMNTVIANTQGRLEQLIIDNKSSGDEVVTVTMDGGSGWK